MPGGGQLRLVAFGNQNKVFNGNPEMTKFYKVFKRYTHFSQESITIPMDGPNELMLDTTIRLRAKLPRHADLLTDLAFVFQIPPIYSSFFGNYAPAFRWIHMIGPLIIDTLSIYVGGSKVQEFAGEWIALRAQADMPVDQYLKWRAMVGDSPELHSPEWGIYGKSASYPFQKGEYPHCAPSLTGSAPSIPKQMIRVPLPFWFSESAGSALPLVSLQLHEVEVQITLRPLRELYRLMDLDFQREPNRYGQTLVEDVDAPTSYDPANPGANDNLTLQNKYAATNAGDLYGMPRNFYTQDQSLAPTTDGFVLNAHLEGNYIYLTEKEQVLFAERELQYLVHQVQSFNFTNVNTRQKFDLDVHGLLHRLLFFGRRSDAIMMRNDYINFSNWKSLSQAPYKPIVGAPVPNSGLALPYGQRDILQSARLVCAGNELFEEKPAKYFEMQTAFESLVGGGVAGLCAGSSVRPEDIMGPVYQIPFALDASDHVQPSGSLNASRIREFQLEVMPWPLDPASPYTYDFTVYAESMNLLKIMNGMGGMAFAV
jgi:hypothetical protein